MEKLLDQKLDRMTADSSCRDFILADAKDGDMGWGIATPGLDQGGRLRSMDEFRHLIRQNVEQGLVDIVIMSASVSEILTIQDRIFDGSSVTPACRANDTTDTWNIQGSRYTKQSSRPFRTATIDHIMYGKLGSGGSEPFRGANLGLFSVTFNNDVQLDLEMLNHYNEFRLEAESKGFRHFLEVFNPNACAEGHWPSDLGRFLNDHIARLLAGIPQSARPLFLKIPYHGPAAMEQLVSYDSSLVVGVLGGAAGTTFDAFHQLFEARKYGARAALYGRMINNSEHQPTFIQHLRWIADGDLNDPSEAVRSYHAAIDKQGLIPRRKIEDDLVPTDRSGA